MNLADLFIAKKLAGGGGGGTGTDNYNDLSNKPQINSTALTGDKSASDLGLQSEIDSDNKISADYVDDTSTTNKFVSAADKLAWSGKQDKIDADHKIDADYVDDTTSDNKFVTASDKTAWNAKQNAIDSSHKLSSDLVDDTGHTNLFVTSTEKSTWNGKQDKIDSSHKLSSTLVSFDSSEAAALASGIDSAKVSQISTNQTNILYAMKVGANNLLDLSNATMTADPSLTVTKDGNSYVVSGNPSTSVQVTFTDFVPCVPVTGSKIAVVGCPSGGSTSAGYSLRGYLDNSWRCSDTGSDTKEFTTSSINKIVLYFAGGHQYTNVRFTPMVVSEEVWNTLGSDYRPPALPNYDLTQLEAEDRAALAEEIDAGAKNKLPNLGVATHGDVTYTWNSDGSVTISGTKTAGAECYVNVINNVSYASLGFKAGDTLVFSNNNDTGFIAVIFYASGSGYTSTITVQNESKEITLPSDKTNILVRLAVSAAATSVNVTIKPMMCTKAAFGVSKAFVPYQTIPKVILNSQAAFTSATTTTYTGVSYVIPANSTVRITATALNAHGNPLEVVIASYANQNLYLARNEQAVPEGKSIGAIATSFVYQTTTSGYTVAILAKYAAATENIIHLVVEKLA